MRLDDSTLVTLGHGVQVLLRDAGAVQFGVDPTRSGVVETPAAQALRRVLDETDWPLEVGELQDSLVSGCKVDAPAARSLIDDLCSYRVLIPHHPTAVAVLGTTPLAREICRQLNASGTTVRIPLIDEDISAFIERQASTPLVMVDHAHDYWRIGRELQRHPSWIVPVLSFDSRVIIGPVGHGGSHPCPVCLLLRLHERDPFILLAVDEIASRAQTMDHVVAAAAAACAVLTVRRLTGIPDPPGVIADAPVPGWAAVVDPLGPKPVTPLSIAVHHRCPVCAAED